MSLIAGQAATEAQTGLSAFKTVGSQLSVTAGAIKPATSPLTRSPVTNRKTRERDSSDQDTVSPTPSSNEGSRRATPTHDGPGPGGGVDAFSWPTQGNYDENRQLLGTEEESSDRQSSEEEDDESKNIWMITKEQLNYYMTQFRTMQPNPHGVIPGTQAKEFFEKSRLPIQDLRQIWQLSDVTKDGCLSLEEFLTAMHLVVLRRNEIPLPDELPVCLRPSNLRHSVIDRHNKDLYSGAGAGGQEPLLETSNNSEGDKTAPDPMSPESQMSSPGRPKPVKFDFNAASVATDPSIACPKPLRLSPDSPYLHSSDESREGSPPTVGRQQKAKVNKREVVYEQLWNVDESSIVNRSRHSSSSSSSSQDTSPQDVDDPDGPKDVRRSNQAPASLPYFASSSANNPSSGTSSINNPSSSSDQMTHRTGNVLGLQKKEGLPPLPPSPPPRPGKTHIRSASLDLNKLKDKNQLPASGALPSLPPRASPFNKHIGDGIHVDDDGRDNKEIAASIHRYKESIALLGRTVQELSQEVNDTVEERVVLEYQLDQLKTIGSSDLSE